MLNPPTNAAIAFNGADTFSNPDPDVLLNEIDPFVTSMEELGSKPIRLTIQDINPGLRQDTLRMTFEFPVVSSVNSSSFSGWLADIAMPLKWQCKIKWLFLMV